MVRPPAVNFSFHTIFSGEYIAHAHVYACAGSFVAHVYTCVRTLLSVLERPMGIWSKIRLGLDHDERRLEALASRLLHRTQERLEILENELDQ